MHSRVLVPTLFLIAFTGVALGGTVVYQNLPSFVAASGATQVAGFDDVTAGGAWGTVVTNGVQVSQVQVVNNLVGFSHPFWFGTEGSSPNWALTGTYAAPLTITFPADVTAFGMLLECFACDSTPNNAGIEWTLRDANGAVVGSGMTVYDLSPSETGHPVFLGVQSTTAFKSVELRRLNADTLTANGGSWLVEDIRFAPVPQVTSAASSAATMRSGSRVAASRASAPARRIDAR